MIIFNWAKELGDLWWRAVSRLSATLWRRQLNFADSAPWNSINANLLGSKASVDLFRGLQKASEIPLLLYEFCKKRLSRCFGTWQTCHASEIKRPLWTARFWAGWRWGLSPFRYLPVDVGFMKPTMPPKNQPVSMKLTEPKTAGTHLTPVPL